MNFNILTHLIIKNFKFGSLFNSNIKINSIIIVLLLNCFYINQIQCQQYSSIINIV
jgi:hypothetical protein